MQTVRVSLVGINSRYIHSSLAPWCLLSGIRAYASHADARVVEGTVNETDEALLSRLRDSQPDVLCFCCYIWNIITVLRLAERLKAEQPSLRIVLGGPEVGYRAEELLERYPFVDSIVSGEGEWPLARLLDAYAVGDSGAGLEGVCVRGHIGEPYLPSFIPPSPYCEEYFAALGGRIAYIETSRGCPFSCAFCLSGRCGSVRYYPEDRAFDELLRLANSGTATVKFVDRTFNADKQRALRFFRFIVDNVGMRIPEGVCFHFEIAGDLLDEETLTVLCEAPAGLFQLEVGLQSFHPETLAAVCRRTDIARLTTNIRHLMACGNVGVHLDLIAGLPEEDLPTCLDSFRTAYALHPHQLQLGFLKRLHGSPLAEQPDRYPGEFATLPPYEVRCTPWLSADDLCVLHTVEEALDRLYNSGRFVHTLAYLTDTAGLDPVAVFRAVGERLTANPPSLDELTVLVWEVFSASVDATALRDALLHDRMAHNPAGVLPACLDTAPEERRRLKRLLDTDDRLHRPTDVRRGTALLSDGTLLYADHHRPHPVTGAYDVCYFREESLGRKRRYLLFDLDGTLTDPALGITRSVQFALRRFGIDEPDLTKLHPFIGPPLLNSFQQFYGMTVEQSREALAAYREYYAVTGIYENEVYDGIPELLRDARRAGYRVIMATSKPEMYACRLMQYFGLMPYFTCIAGADMGEKRANKTAVIQSAMQREGLTDPTQAVMIGDRCFDMEGGRNLGMETIGVMYGYGSEEELRQSGADAIAATVGDLRRLIL